MYQIGMIFEGDYPEDVAAWCNNNQRSYIAELPVQDDGVRRFQIVGITEPTEAELAALALAEAKAERAAAVAALVVEVDGMTFDGDEKAQERMARAVLMAESPEESMEWVLADSSVAVVTADQLRRACRAAGKAMGTLWVTPYKS